MSRTQPTGMGGWRAWSIAYPAAGRGGYPAADGFAAHADRARRLRLLLKAYGWAGTVGDVADAFDRAVTELDASAGEYLGTPEVRPPVR